MIFMFLICIAKIIAKGTRRASDMYVLPRMVVIVSSLPIILLIILTTFHNSKSIMIISTRLGILFLILK